MNSTVWNSSNYLNPSLQFSFSPSANFFKIWALEMHAVCSYETDQRWIDSLLAPMVSLVDCAAEFLILCTFLARSTHFVFVCVHILSVPDCSDCPTWPLFADLSISISSRIFLIVFESTLWYWLEMLNSIEGIVRPLGLSRNMSINDDSCNIWDVSSRFLIYIWSSLLVLSVAILQSANSW